MRIRLRRVAVLLALTIALGVAFAPTAGASDHCDDPYPKVWVEVHTAPPNPGVFVKVYPPELCFE